MKVIKSAAYIKVSAGLNARIKSKLNAQIHGIIQGYHDQIPISAIFDVLSTERIVPLQEDGTRWSGMLVGGAECGSDESSQQVANFDLAFSQNGGLEPIANAALYLSWCKMPSGRYEVVSYVS